MTGSAAPRHGARDVGLEARIFGSLIFRGYHRLRGSGVLPRIDEYDRLQWLSGAEVRAAQASKLGALLQHAAAHVPYYRDLLASRPSGSAPEETLAAMPRLTKALIRANAQRLVAANVPRGQLDSNSTSGSTGEPLYFLTDHRSSNCRKAAVVINRRWAGIEPGEREAYLWGSPIDQRQAHALRGRIHGWLTRTKLLSAYDLSRSSMRRYLETLRSFAPRLLIAYPSVLEAFAAEARSSPEALQSLKAIIVSAETLYPYQRELFQQVFGAPVFNRYGSRELGDMAQECELHGGLHVNAGRVFLEVVREDLSPCAPGEAGDILVTDLDNYGMPLIRYAIGDRAAYAAEACPCGRGLPLLEAVEGRSLEVVRFPNGSAVGGTYWTILLRKLPGLDQFQVVQRAAGDITVRYVAGAPVSEEFQDYVRRDVLERGGPDVRLAFERTGSIPLNVAGKRRLVVREG
jgi:phenylacetate-CoA ligase